MLIQPIDIFVHAWLIVAVLSAAYVAWDQFTGNPEPAVMKWGFVLVTLYMGPIGLLLYVMADKEPKPGGHEEFVKPLWKQGVGSTVHCVAGDATGIILAAVITALVGLPMWADLIVEYTAGFLFGLLIFQALFMRKTMGGSYAENVRRSFLPELISMNCMMAGMAPVMVNLMMGRDMRAMWPGEPLFWMVMSLGIVAGFAIAYPVNVWMVSRGMKHGLMTERAKSTAAKKHESTSSHPDPDDASSSKKDGMAAMDHGGMKMPRSSTASAKLSTGRTKAQKTAKTAATHEGHQMGSPASSGDHRMQSDVTWSSESSSPSTLSVGSRRGALMRSRGSDWFRQVPHIRGPQSPGCTAQYEWIRGSARSEKQGQLAVKINSIHAAIASAPVQRDNAPRKQGFRHV